MATENYARFAAGVADTLAPIGTVTHRRFFGGQGLVCGAVQFAMIIQGVLYLVGIALAIIYFMFFGAMVAAMLHGNFGH